MDFDLTSPLAQEQLAATRAFADAFRGEPAPKHLAHLPQVLVTGFGRFLHHTDNASGYLVSDLVPSAKYPRTERGELSNVDLPAPQFSMGWHQATLPSGKEVALCGMIFPVQWGLPPALIAKQCAVMTPAFVVMNGIAGSVQPLWIEQGAANAAVSKVDGTGLLQPLQGTAGEAQRLDPKAPPALACYASFEELRSAAEEEIASADRADPSLGISEVLAGSMLQAFARSENRYLCNEVTFAACQLLRATKTPRVFLHWPSSMTHAHVATGARVLARLVDVELSGTTHRVLGGHL